MKVAVLASGEGTNFQAVVEHVKLGILKNVEVSMLIYDRENANVVNRAKRLGVDSLYLGIKDRYEFDTKLVEILKGNGINLVLLAGFLRILGEYVINEFKWRIMNIHPSLLPCFGGKGMYGLKVHREVLASGAKVSGCTVHYVDVAVDVGPIILQESLPITDDIYEVFTKDCKEGAKMLANRIHKIEHRLYPKAVQLHADKRLRVERVRIETKEGVKERDIVRINYGGNWEKEWKERQDKLWKGLSF
jgi:phosphoribosylglycinamide formyltransferase-1